MKRSFFQAAVTSILLYGCTTWTLTKRLEKKLDGNYTRMLRAILNKSWQQHPTRHQLYGHLPPITKTIQVRRTRSAGHCWRSRDELIRDVLLWIPTHGRAKAGRPARTYIQQLCEDTGCCPEDLPRAMNDREGVAREGQRYPCYQCDMMMMTHPEGNENETPKYSYGTDWLRKAYHLVPQWLIIDCPWKLGGYVIIFLEKIMKKLRMESTVEGRTQLRWKSRRRYSWDMPTQNYNLL